MRSHGRDGPAAVGGGACWQTARRGSGSWAPGELEVVGEKARSLTRGEATVNHSSLNSQGDGERVCPKCGREIRTVSLGGPTCTYVLPRIGSQPVGAAPRFWSLPARPSPPPTQTMSATPMLLPSQPPPATPPVAAWVARPYAGTQRREDLVEDQLVRAALARSYTTPTVITLFLYCAFYVPGLLANLMYFFSTRADRELTGASPRRHKPLRPSRLHQHRSAEPR